MSNSLTPKDVLLAIYPTIEDTLIEILTKFNANLNSCVKRKNEKIVSTEKLTNLLEVFPRKYNNYSLCVDKFVSFGKRSPSEAINFLLSLLPQQEGNTLFKALTSKIQFYAAYSDLIDLFLYLFFADCSVQIMSVTQKHEKSSILLEMCYKLVPLGYEQYQEPMRLKLVKQLSVLFGFLSKSELPKILERFENNFTQSDPILFLYLHRFMRLSTSEKVDFDSIAMLFSRMINISKQFVKKPKHLIVWAETLCSLCIQLNCDGVAAVEAQMNEIYSFAMEKTHAKDADDAFIVLVGIILQRFSQLRKKYFNDYFQKSILDKASKSHRTCGCLKAFLVVLRGNFVSKSSSFWEWGKFNAQSHIGVEATHLNDPAQDQASQNSYTSLFFKFFIPVPKLEQHSSIAGEILLNLAARDFAYFTKETAPKLIKSLKNDTSYLPLFECLCRIVNPDLHFEEWAQTNPRNTNVKIGTLIPSLFVMLKDILFRVASNTLKFEHCDSIFSVPLNQSVEYPVFSIPLHYDGKTKAMQERIFNATEQCTKLLEEAGVKKEKTKQTISFEKGDIEETTEEEENYIKLLSLLQRIVNTSDLLSNTIGSTIVSCVTAKSKAVAYFAIQVINLLFSICAENRIEIYDIILTALDRSCNSKNINDMCILLLLINKLFDLSMRPKVKRERLEKFVSHGQATSIALLCFESTEVRDMTMNLLERLDRFGSSFGIDVPLFEAVNDVSITRKVFSKLNPTKEVNVETMTPRTIASSEYTSLFNEFLPNIVIALDNRKEMKSEVFHKVYQVINSSLGTLGKNPTTIKDQASLSIFYNFISVIFCCLPVFEQSSLGMVQKYFGNAVYFDETRKTLSQDMQQTQKLIDNFISFILIKKKEVPKNAAIEKCFEHVSWYLSSYFLDMVSDIKNQNMETQEFLSTYSTIIKMFFKAENFQYALISSQKTSQAFNAIIQLLQKFFTSNELNKGIIMSDSSIVDQKLNPLNTIICKNYCEIVEAFTRNLAFPAQVIEGPVLLPAIPDFANTDDFKNTLQICVIMCLNFSHTKDKELNKAAEKAVSGCSCICRIFNKNFPVTENIMKILLNDEEVTGSTLRRALYYHFDLIIKDYLSACYEKKKETANTYFKTLYSFLCGEQPKKETRAQMVVRMLAPFQDNEDLKSLKLSNDELELQKSIVIYSGNILVCAIAFLMDMDYDIRFIAFKLIQRIAPLALSVLSDKPAEECKALIEDINAYAALMYTSYSSISPKHVAKIVKILSQYLYRLSEGVIEECIRAITISAPTKQGRIDQSLIFDVLNTFIKNISLDNGGYIKEKTRKLSIYTPFSLTESLLNVYQSVNHSSVSVYLQAWQKMESELETTVTHLLSVKDEKMKAASKAVLVYLARINCDEICRELCERLTFSYWFFVREQGNLDSDNVPQNTHLSEIDIALLALSEIAQVSVEPLIPYLPILVNFSVLFYDSYPQSNELMFIVFSGLDGAESLTPLFTGETKIESLAFFTRKIHKFIATKAKKVLHKWGEECIKWVTGCGDLTIAANAATVFSFILNPFDGVVLQTIIRSFHSVAICEQTPESINYLARILMIINRSIDKMKNNEAFDGLFNYLFRVSLPFIFVPQNELCVEALCIVGKYISMNQCTYDELNELFPSLCSLMIQLDDKKALDGIFLSLFSTPKPKGRGKRPKISSVAFCLFLPRLIACYGAFHNREPFVSLTDEEVKHVLEIGKCIAISCDLPENVSPGLSECLQNPEDFPFDEFSLKVCRPLCDDVAIVTAASYYTAMAEKGDEVLKCAIFSIVTSVLRGCTIRQDANAFLSLMPTASSHALKSPYSSFSAALMELFVEITGIESPEDYECDNAAEIKLPVSKFAVAEKLEFIEDEEAPKMPNGNTDLATLILIAPFQKQFWNSRAIKNTRKKLEKIVVQPHTRRFEEFEAKKGETPSSKLQLNIPKRVDDYICYKTQK